MALLILTIMNHEQENEFLINELSEIFLEKTSFHSSLVSTKQWEEFEKQVIAHLQGQVLQLLHHNMDRLLHFLYTLDVAQKDSDNAFKMDNLDDISLSLAKAIFQRQLKKAYYRLSLKKQEAQNRN
jgi:hypothetical protein